jgi:serine/threonine protein kinase/tetratricopeptide (TPR) repeat protein
MKTPETPAGPAAPSWRELDRFVAAYESCQTRQGHAEIRAFLPEPRHPLYLSVLRELVRVDLEYGWERGRAPRAEEYFAAFPELKADPESVREIAFEEYRLRQQAGERPSPAEYQRRFGADTRDWPAPPAETRTDVPPFSSLAGGGRAAGPDDLERAAAVYLEHYDRRPRQPGGDPEAVAPLPGGPEHAELFLELHRSDPQAAYRLAQALTTLPTEGVQFLDFHLVRELGRGAFGRVYLARQGGLADRPVALKVSGDLTGEPQMLARLQHTHIVPVYSVHRAGPFQALCMPFFGATTLAEVLKELRRLPAPPASGRWLAQCRMQNAECRMQNADGGGTRARLEGMSYVEAVLWMGQCLADGLAHAHERTILHGDIKPANVLVSDDGQPMLLDFNLSQDTRLRGSAPAAAVGGTLPYMAPEHLEAFRQGTHRPDPRSDLYALGLILYELLTGRYPFPLRTGPVSAVLPQMIEDRRAEPPRLRRWNPAVSPAVESIVRRCLEPDPARRYRSARELHTDLQRQRAHLPLRHAPEPSWRERSQKWLRRHPRLSSSYSVAAVAALLLAGLASLYVVRSQELRRREEELTRSTAVNTLHRFHDELQTSKFLLCTPSADLRELREGLEVSRQALARYRVLDDPDWPATPAFAGLPGDERDRLRGELGELLLLRAQSMGVAALVRPGPAGRDGDFTDALRLNRLAETYLPGESGRRLARLQRSALLEAAGDKPAAKKLRAETLPPRTARDLYLAGTAKMTRKEYAAALVLLRKATRENPHDAVAWYALGVCQARLRLHEKAVACFDTSIALWPRFYGSYAQRGAAHLALHDYDQAAADCTEALRRRPDYFPARVNRALARAGRKDFRGAVADLTRVLETVDPVPTRLFFMRATFRHQAGDAEGARQDLAEGLRRRPTDDLSWVARGMHRLAGDPRRALADFEEALKINPASLGALQNKAHILSERLGQPAEAVRALDRALGHDPDNVPARAGRGVLLARLNRRGAALQDATRVLQRDRSPATLYQVACIYALTSRQQPEDRREALRLLERALDGGYGGQLLDVDPDLNPLRNSAEFRRLLETARASRTGQGLMK